LLFFLFEKAVSLLASPFYFSPSHLDLNRAADVFRKKRTQQILREA